MPDDKKSEAKEKTNYGEKMRKLLEEQREKDRLNRTKKKAKKAKMRK
jgi:hypothetical protein